MLQQQGREEPQITFLTHNLRKIQFSVRGSAFLLVHSLPEMFLLESLLFDYKCKINLRTNTTEVNVTTVITIRPIVFFILTCFRCLCCSTFKSERFFAPIQLRKICCKVGMPLALATTSSLFAVLLTFFVFFLFHRSLICLRFVLVALTPKSISLRS
jgi:hypothetical protein